MSDRDADPRALVDEILRQSMPLAQKHGMMVMVDVVMDFLRAQYVALGPVPARPDLLGGLVRLGRMEVLCSLADLVRDLDLDDLGRLHPIAPEGGKPRAQASPYDA